jgi:RNA polymerase sigma-70 factor (ECF subfamily)
VSPPPAAPELPAAPAAIAADVVARAQQGDAAAFETIYHAHAGRVFAICVRMSGDRVAATELAQDVFVRLWEKLPLFRGESAFATWLHRLAVNVVLERSRGDLRRLERVGSAEDEGADAPASPSGMGIEDRLDLERAMALLPAGPRQVFVLHEIEGFAHDEIATMTGLAVATVRVHLFRARRQLMQEMTR